MKVKVIQLPGTVKFADNLAAGATVAEAIQAAGISLSSGESLKLNGVDTTPDARIAEGDVVLVAKGAKGNSKPVEVVTRVFGRDLSTLSKGDLFDAAKRLRAEIDADGKANAGIES